MLCSSTTQGEGAPTAPTEWLRRPSKDMLLEKSVVMVRSKVRCEVRTRFDVVLPRRFGLVYIV